MPILRSGTITSALNNDNLGLDPSLPLASTMASPTPHQLFRAEYDVAIDDARLLFPDESENDLRNSFLAKKREELLTKHGFLGYNQSNPGFDNSQSQPLSDAEKRSRLVKNFVATCNKFDEKSESMDEFFDRLERKCTSENVDDKAKLNILDILLPSSYFKPYDESLSEKDQFKLYKKRALVKAKCTPIDILYQAVNPNFDSNNSFTHIFEQTQYCIAKCKDAFPLIGISCVHGYCFLKDFLKEFVHN